MVNVNLVDLEAEVLKLPFEGRAQLGDVPAPVEFVK